MATMATTVLPWSIQIPPSLQHRCCSSSMPDDEVMGAYLLSSIIPKVVQSCANCGTSDTPLWRKGWYDALLNKHIMLCNACGLKYAKNQYCPYCKYIYKMNQDVHAQRDQWLNCNTCRRWVHDECESKYGIKYRKLHGINPSNNSAFTLTCNTRVKEDSDQMEVDDDTSSITQSKSQQGGDSITYCCPDCKKEQQKLQAVSGSN